MSAVWEVAARDTNANIVRNRKTRRKDPPAVLIIARLRSICRGRGPQALLGSEFTPSIPTMCTSIAGGPANGSSLETALGRRLHRTAAPHRAILNSLEVCHPTAFRHRKDGRVGASKKFPV